MRRLTALRRKSTSKEHSLSTETRGQSGQALVESTVVFILVLMLLAGLVEFGWAYFHYLALQDAAGEGAAYGIINPTWHYSDFNTDPTIPENRKNADPNNIEYRVRHESQTGILNWSAPTTTVTIDAPHITPGNQVTVTVAYTHHLITPLLSEFVSDGTIILRASAVQTVLSPAPTPTPTPPTP